MVAVECTASSTASLCPIADDDGQHGTSEAAVLQQHGLRCEWSPVDEEVLCDECGSGEDEHGTATVMSKTTAMLTMIMVQSQKLELESDG